jgi:LysM repeat protein
VDTLKSLAVVTLLGAVLYGVYVVASKPDKPLPPEIATHVAGSDAPPLVEFGAPAAGPSIGVPAFEVTPAPAPAAASPGLSLPAPSVSPLAPGSPATALPEMASLETGMPEKRAVAVSPYSAPRDGSPVVEATAPPQDASQYDQIQRSTFETPAPGSTSPVSSSPYGDGSYSSSESRGPESATSSGSRDAEIEAAKERLRVYAFRQAWATAQEQVADGRHREALLALSAFYNDTAIPTDDREALLGWLDALAAKVVYSTEHLMEAPYEVHRNETLYTIARKYHVPYLLLQNINGVRDPEVLIPGTKLKVLPGPFRAEVDLKRGEITLFVQNLYAGRFPFTQGSQPARPGTYAVKQKSMAKEYHGPQGKLEAKDPRNPYGGIWIDLGGDVCIHGSPSDAYADQSVGCISLAQRDAEDLFAILLDEESAVVIKE